MGGLPLSRVWVIAFAAVMVMEAAGILLGGLVSGGWMWGLIWSIVAVAAMVDWLRIRETADGKTRAVADRMITATTVALLGLALKGFHQIDAWMSQ